MDIRQTDPGGLRQRLSQVLAARPLLRGLLRALGAGGFCFVLAGAGLLDGPVPLALAPVCVLPFGPAAACTQIAAAGITASGTPNGSCTRTSPASRHTAAAYGRSRAFAGAGESMRTLSVSKTSRKMSCSAACSPPSARRTKMTPSSA